MKGLTSDRAYFPSGCVYQDAQSEASSWHSEANTQESALHANAFRMFSPTHFMVLWAGRQAKTQAFAHTHPHIHVLVCRTYFRANASWCRFYGGFYLFRARLGLGRKSTVFCARPSSLQGCLFNLRARRCKLRQETFEVEEVTRKTFPNLTRCLR